ncbi:anthrone oxygenase family protein [Hymenobacter sp. B1770]|uniref:anthrone oxygenase family protein n=1 Tax=Hymenobacter sp. B1770 TaxID=1718788 RepID=UPI003CF9D25C
MLATARCARHPYSWRFRLLVAATGIFWAGSLGVTVAVNIPLNETLASFQLTSATAAQTAAARTHFSTTWNTWHDVRTVASIVALALLAGACLARDTDSGVIVPK